MLYVEYGNCRFSLSSYNCNSKCSIKTSMIRKMNDSTTAGYIMCPNFVKSIP